MQTVVVVVVVVEECAQIGLVATIIDGKMIDSIDSTGVSRVRVVASAVASVIAVVLHLGVEGLEEATEEATEVALEVVTVVALKALDLIGAWVEEREWARAAKVEERERDEKERAVARAKTVRRQQNQWILIMSLIRTLVAR